MVQARTQAPVARHRTPDAKPVSAARGFRPDVQGLRALAVSLVVVYHLFPSAVPGGFVGVDVFFVISGFLITGHLLRGYQRNGRIGFVDFYGRRARRLMPAAVLVLIVTWIGARIVLPSSRLPDTARQTVASALYFQNWVLSHDAVDYLKSDDAATPVQHFWSLSVEEQFYLVWPLLFLAAALIARRRTRTAGHAAALALAVVVVAASFWYSVHETAANPAAAYFVTTTRMWELGLGGLLALLPRRVTDPLARCGPLAWIALAAVIASAFLIDGASPFPGYLALWPVGAATVLLACGSAGARLGPARLTSLRPVVFLGDISYSLYLWHWPVIVLWKSYSGGGIGLLDGPVILVVSIVLAWLTKVFVEDRVRLAPMLTQHRWRSLATVLVAVVPVTAAYLSILNEPAPFNGHLDAKHPGGAVLVSRVTAPTGVAVVPPVASAATDIPAYEAHGCEVAQSSSTPLTCIYGDTTAPKLTVALVGDSVAGQWQTALDEIGKRRHWKIVTELRSLCPFTAAITINNNGSTAPYTSCQQWGRNVQRLLLTTIKPDVVLTSDRPVLGTPDNHKAGPASFGQVATGMATYWRQLQAAGIGVVPLHESPEMHEDVPDCLSARDGTVTKCTVSRSKAVVQDTPIDQAAAQMHGAVHVVDMTDTICTSSVCSPVVGNVVVYRDRHHLTVTYTRTLESYLERRLLATAAMTAHD